ncbi:MAG: hypothetical protein A3H28_13655 [Acidobacteria bacterium RIFCSPLOWO2_02_FULL_61_28]|nr:MAG: hypothetical protein A3H28_13655 [Acidobacteria bacterium RIFCSPLOWO2_02_FULL_61_28]
MAAISQKSTPEEVLPFLARNVVVEGYQYWQDKARKPTEYLKLLKDYLLQARELQTLAGSEGVLRVANCAEVERLLPVIGYRFRTPCGPGTTLETADPEKAFLAVDSGFPLVELEEALRQGTPFSYSVVSTEVPVLFDSNDWAGNEKSVLDTLIDDPALARLYWALARLDERTRLTLRQSPGIQKLLPLAAVLDFYGSHVYIRSGRVVVPGGAAAEPAWKALVGVGPDVPGEFVLRLLEKDQGWVAAYFDTLARVPRSQQTYFTNPERLSRFYEALRGKNLSPSPARPVFRPVAGLLLLLTRLQLESNGQPHIPGNLEVWKEVFRRKSDSKVVRDWAKRATGWSRPEQFVEAMFSLSRVPSKDSPFSVYLLLTEIDRRRSPQQRLSPATVRLLAERFSRYQNQYLLFTEWRELDNASITQFVTTATALDRVPDKMVRANALGTFQANLGLWQILARQEQIPAGNLNSSFQRVMRPFADIKTSAQLFDAARASLGEVLRAAAGKPDLSQEEMIALLGGPEQSTPAGQQMRQEMANRIRAVLDAQRLVSLNTLFSLADGLSGMTQGKAASDSLMRLAGELREFELPRPIFTERERSEWASGLHKNPHADLQVRTDLRKVINESGKAPRELADARGLLTPFFRDVLVGFNYAYYEPPGAQMLHNNTLFVRSHDFSGQMTPTGEESWQTPRMFGRGWSASGGAHLAGSLADLPYVLAQLEQDFIVPENTQSLIWADLVPGLLTAAVLPRWWRVTPAELRAVALYQRFGEELLLAAGNDPRLRQRVLEILFDRMLPQRLEHFEQALEAGRPQEVLPEFLPTESAYLAAEFRRLYPGEAGAGGPAEPELARLVREHPAETSWERIAQDFGVPHPTLIQTYTRELLVLKPLPTFLGYSSRLLAESWESNNLYWARLAEEKGHPPAMLHRLVPALTHRMVEKIFATHLEDWPAVLRAMREAGEEFRAGRILSAPNAERASGQ